MGFLNKNLEGATVKDLIIKEIKDLTGTCSCISSLGKRKVGYEVEFLVKITDTTGSKTADMKLKEFVDYDPDSEVLSFFYK